MPASAQYLLHNDGFVPTEAEFEALETRVDNLDKALAQVAATLVDLASEVTRLRNQLEGPA